LRGQVNGNNVKFRRCGAMNHPKSIRDEIRDRRGVTKRVGNQEVKLGRSIERGN